MEAWSRFLDTFFNWDVMERYFPAIMKGVVVTIEIAAAVVVTGTLLGLTLAIARTFRFSASISTDKSVRNGVTGKPMTPVKASRRRAGAVVMERDHSRIRDP